MPLTWMKRRPLASAMSENQSVEAAGIRVDPANPGDGVRSRQPAAKQHAITSRVGVRPRVLILKPGIS